MEVTTHSTEETKRLAQKLSKRLISGDVIALYGDLGAGKTTFVRFLVAALGFSTRVQSPTFVIARKYTSTDNAEITTINHLDLYRITSESEIAGLDLTDYFNQPKAITLIEWPEYAEGSLPARTIKIVIDPGGENERSFHVQNIR